MYSPTSRHYTFTIIFNAWPVKTLKYFPEMQGQLIVLWRLFFFFLDYVHRRYACYYALPKCTMLQVDLKPKSFLFFEIRCLSNKSGPVVHFIAVFRLAVVQIAVVWPAVVQLAVYWSAVQFIIKKNLIYIRITRTC